MSDDSGQSKVCDTWQASQAGGYKLMPVILFNSSCFLPPARKPCSSSTYSVSVK